MPDRITDLWFRSDLPLSEIARRLELGELIEDSEEYWEWVIGTFADEQLDITRTHTKPAGTADTRVFLYKGQDFSDELIAQIVARLRPLVSGPIAAGRWQYKSGNHFDLIALQTY